uniref:Transposase n=1 Tax=Cucumis melo TaxID=3656 RepID=A0A9I9CC77_CUCME
MHWIFLVRCFLLLLVNVVEKPNAYLWRPTSEMTCIEKALGSTVAWPSDK